MGLFSIVSFAITNLLLLAVGFRLLWVWRRTRRAPELSIGVAFSGAGGGSVGMLMAAAGALEGLDPYAVWAVCAFLLMLGSSSLAVGVWRIFHPEKQWAAVLAAFWIAVGFGGWMLRALPGEVPSMDAGGPGFVLECLSCIGVYAWIATEAFRYHRMLRRRLRLGLADPLIAHQFQLWGIGGTAAAVAIAVSLYSILVLGHSMTRSAFLFGAVQLLALGAAVSIWLAFFPPAVYARRFRSAAQSPAA